MNKPHPHRDLIKLWADGHEIQIKTVLDTWGDEPEPDWDVAYKYRVKPYEAWVNVCSNYIDQAFDTPELAELGVCKDCIRTVHVREVEE